MSVGKVDYPSLGVPKLDGGFAEADRQTIAGIILSQCAISSQCATGTEGPLSISPELEKRGLIGRNSILSHNSYRFPASIP